jgi:hypothetical protein
VIEVFQEIFFEKDGLMREEQYSPSMVLLTQKCSESSSKPKS